MKRYAVTMQLDSQQVETDRDRAIFTADLITESWRFMVDAEDMPDAIEGALRRWNLTHEPVQAGKNLNLKIVEQFEFDD